jgi:adenylate cyclase
MGKEPLKLFTKDSLAFYHNYINEGWKFKNGDEPAWSSTDFNDDDWQVVKTTLYNGVNDTPYFKDVGWFRTRFVIDSTVAGRPMAFSLTHFGASEIFLDGKLIKTYGKIAGTDSSVYYDPQEVPFVVTIAEAGEHLLAIRYANFNAVKNNRYYRQPMAGFKIMVGEAGIMIEQKELRTAGVATALMVLSGIFIALCLLHLFMFLFYKTGKSNLYFSIFMASLAAAGIIYFISYENSNPSTTVKSYFLLNPIYATCFVALSGFISELFNKKKIRFIIILAAGILTIALRFAGMGLASYITSGIVISVSFETFFTVLFAIIKKVKGARIIGAGLLFSSLFIISIFIAAIINGGDLNVNDTTLGGQIIVICLALAILSMPLSMSLYLAWNFSYINRDLAVQLDHVKILSQKTLEQEQEKQRLLENRKEELEKEVHLRTSELREEKKKSDDLLLNILPSEIADEIKRQGRSQAKTFNMVTVMFTDFKHFTQISEKVSAELLVSEIDYCFSAFDRIIQIHNIEKIKTVGDAYICAGGMPVLTFTHAEDTLKAALEIRSFMAERKKEKEAKGEIPFEIRIGIHTGSVVAGIVGIKKFAYDIWGDTVNLAARMEQHSEAGKINISGATYELVKDKFNCVHRGKVAAKNKGDVDMYFVE